MDDVAVTDLSIIIVNWNTAGLLRQCLASLPSLPRNGAVEIVVVDNASSDDSVALVRREFPRVRLIESERNLGFARGNNLGIKTSSGRYVLLLNSDTIVHPGALAGLVRFLREHQDAGAVGPRLVCADGTPQPYAFGGDPTPGYLLARGLNRLLFRRYLHDWATSAVREVDWVSGACLLVRRDAVAGVGLLDERMFMYFEDNDWCLRLRRAGWKVYYDPRVSVTHLGGQSLAKNPAARRAYYDSLNYFYAKHYRAPARLVLKAGLAFYRLAVRRV